MRRLALVLLVTTAVSGCAPAPAHTVADTPTPATGAPKLAPPVPAPRNARGVAACDLLTTEQKRAVHADLSTERPATQGMATRCGWDTTTADGLLLVTTAPDYPVGGLEGLYLLRSTYAVSSPVSWTASPSSALSTATAATGTAPSTSASPRTRSSGPPPTSPSPIRRGRPVPSPAGWPRT
jgi:hypothetical protein